jgi:hypothetical protein
MRRFSALLVILSLTVTLVSALLLGGCTCTVNNAKEVNVLVDSTYKYHLAANQDTVHLSKAAHEMIVWTFDQDTTVDSVVALFGTSPFAQTRFEFSDSAAFSGLPTVMAGATVYNYTLTVYPHGQSPVTVDPGVIIDE